MPEPSAPPAIQPAQAGRFSAVTRPTPFANADTVMQRSSASLLAEVFPDVEINGKLGEHDTLLSIAKARRILGYSPQHSWRHM